MRPWERRRGGGERSSSGANSRRVNAEWADRKGRGGGGGGPGKTARLRSWPPGPPYLCLRVRSPAPACRKHRVRAEGEEPRVRKEGTPGTEERGRSLPLVRESG